MESYKRYVIRRTDNGKYYDGSDTWANCFDEFRRAKVFKTSGAAKTSCGHIYEGNRCGLEVVEIETVTTDNVIPYEWRNI